MSNSATPWTAALQASLSITNSRSPPKSMSIELVTPSNHFILCHPLLLPSIFPSITVFSNESALHIRWPKYWSFSFNISPSNEHLVLISFRMDCLDLLADQGTLKSKPCSVQFRICFCCFFNCLNNYYGAYMFWMPWQDFALAQKGKKLPFVYVCVCLFIWLSLETEFTVQTKQILKSDVPS